MARIALFGATGMIGSRILTEALDRGHDVVAVVRDQAKLTPTDPAREMVPAPSYASGAWRTCASSMRRVLPDVTSGNTIAPCVVIGYRAAVFLRG